MTIYVVADMNDRWNDGDYYEEIESDYGYFTTLEEAQQFVDDLNAPILASYAQRLEEYELKTFEWTIKNNQARKLGFSNPDYRPTHPGSPPPGYVVVEIKPHEVTT